MLYQADKHLQWNVWLGRWEENCGYCLSGQYGFHHFLPQDPYREAVKAVSEVYWKLAELWAQRLVISGLKSSWEPIISAVPQETILDPILINIFIIDMVDGTKCTLRKFYFEIKLSVLDFPKSQTSIKNNVDSLGNGLRGFSHKEDKAKLSLVCPVPGKDGEDTNWNNSRRKQ